jgi:hypothetical protein
MQRIFISIFIFILISACKKTDSPCQSCNSNCSHPNGDISGNWKLEATRYYSAPGNPNPPWVNADPNKPVTIAFTNDSLFSFNDNYFWKMDSLDRYKIIDSADFKIYSSNPSFAQPITVKILNSKEIDIHYMGIDRSTEEKYTCF